MSPVQVPKEFSVGFHGEDGICIGCDSKKGNRKADDVCNGEVVFFAVRTAFLNI
jgi:hypothetical protein